MQKMHRAQILLDPEQHHTLGEIAQREGTSISEIVRTAVDQWLNERKENDVARLRLEALEQIAQHHQAILGRRNGRPIQIDLSAILEQMREERNAELLSNAFDHDRD